MNVMTELSIICSIRYLWWVEQVEGMVESEVDEPKESGVQLCESCHYSVVDICWVLKGKKTTVTMSQW